MVTVDRAGIARTARALGGEGTNLLLLRPTGNHDQSSLDSALPADDGDSPANGGWFPGPQGWLLLVEGLDEVVDPWIEQLAAGLVAAGIEGSLSGAGTASEPAWARKLDQLRGFHGLIGLRPRQGFGTWDKWAPRSEALATAVEVGVGWLTAHSAEVVAVADVRSRFAADQRTAARIMTGDTLRIGQSSAYSYRPQGREVRSARLSHRAGLALSERPTNKTWRAAVGQLRTAILGSPLRDVSIAMISHRNWNTLLGSDLPGSHYYHRRSYGWHPELWEQFILDPCGIQVLTQRHLDAANDLSMWRTTRLDDQHFLVEARDLEPWFGTPRLPAEPIDPAVLDNARQEFGDMILTPHWAAELGVDIKPAPRTD